MAGKGYVSNRAPIVVGEKPFPDYPGRWPDNDNRGPKVPWKPPRRRPPGKFPHKPNLVRPPFGKKPLVMYPNPLGPVRWPRINPWLLLGLGPMVGGWFIQQPRPDFAGMGFTLCWDGGGPKEAWSSIYLDNCVNADFWKNLSLQVPGGAMNDTPSNVSYGFAVGPYVNPEKTRMQYKELWARNYYNNNPFKMFPPAVWFPDPLLPFSDPDPNLWVPHQPYTPKPPERVYPRSKPDPQPRTWPRSVSGPKPETRGDPDSHKPPRVDPEPDIPHTRKPPTPRERERKYSAARGSLAAELLRQAARVYNGVTEAFDLVSAVYKALPPGLISRQPDNLVGAHNIMQHMLGMIWQHRNEIDFGEAIKNIAMNQIEDAAWGRYFRTLDKINRTGTNVGGYDRELGYLNELYHELHGGS